MLGRALVSACVVGILLAAPSPGVADSGKTNTQPPAKVAVQTFHLKYRTAAEASDVAQVFLSDAGSVTVHPAQDTVTVQDTPESVRRIGEILEVLDQPQPSMRVEVRLIEASNDPPKPGAPDLEGIDPGVRKMFHFSSYRIVGKAILEWDAPGPMEVDLGKRYRLSTTASWQQRLGVAPAGPSPGAVLEAKDLRIAWKFGGAATVRGMLRSRRLVLDDLTLTRRGSANGHPLLRTRAVLSPRQRVIIGTSSSEESDRALVLMVRALEPEKRPGRS